MGEPIYCGTCRAYLGNTAHDCASPRTSAGGSVDPRDARIAELEASLGCARAANDEGTELLGEANARIAELEAALAGLVDAQAMCLVNDCGRPATLGHLGPMPDVCEAHRDDIEYPNRLKRNDKADAIEAAERALGRRK